MNHNRWKARGAAGAACGCLIATFIACSSDDNTVIIETVDAACTTPDSAASGSSGSTSGSTTGSSGSTGATGSTDAGHDGAVADSAIADTSTHDVATPDTGSAVDTGAPDATLVRPPSPNICSMLDAIWNNPDRQSGFDWPNEIVNGPPSNPDGGANDEYYTWDGYSNLILGDCDIQYYGNLPLNDGTENAWTNRVVAFTVQVFGCADSATDAGNRFELVPSDIYGQPLTTAELDRFRAWFVEATVQAVANEVNLLPVPPPLLTPEQIDQIDAVVEYYEMTYPNIVQSASFQQSTCPDGI